MKKIVLPSFEKRGCESSAGPRVTCLAWEKSVALVAMIQMSRWVAPSARRAKTMYLPSEDQSGSVHVVSATQAWSDDGGVSPKRRDLNLKVPRVTWPTR